MKKPFSLRPASVRLLCAAGLLALSGVCVASYRTQQSNQEQLYDISVIPPTCTDSGYSLYTNLDNGATYIDDVVPAAGHAFGQWTVEEPQGLDCGMRKRSCEVCGAEETQTLYPELEIPRLGLEGSLEGVGKKSEVNITARFVSDETSFETCATVKYQGHESLGFDKKNYTLKLFTDEARSEKYKLTFSHWNPENKFVLKANYVDPSQCRNLVSADVWAEVVASRENIPKELTGLSNYGAVDGFPVALYLNGQFQGLYTMNLHKDDDLFGMSDGAREAILITNHSDSDEAFFRAAAEFGEDSPWEVEFCGTEDSQWATEKLNALITFVMESDDETFRTELSDHLDVDSAIDYLLTIYALGLTSNGSSNLILAAYGENEPWIASVYDMETAFGLYADGSGAWAPEEFLPARSGEGWDSATGSLLWDRLLTGFLPQIRTRYAQLRQEILDPDALCRRVTDFTAGIPGELYQADAGVYPWPAELDHNEQITNYITQRIALLDEFFLK